MKPMLYITMLFILLIGCKAPMPLTESAGGDDYIKTIDIDFYLTDRKNYEYQFRFMNQWRDKEENRNWLLSFLLRNTPDKSE